MQAFSAGRKAQHPGPLAASRRMSDKQLGAVEHAHAAHAH
jgi:hypothetical protein